MAYNQIQKINNPTPSANDQWGLRTVIDEYHMIVAREGTNVTEVFKKDIDGVWQIQGNVTGQTGQAMYGNYFTVTRAAAQALDIYDKDDLTTTIQIFTEATGTATFGNSVAISENYIVIGDQASDTNTGQIYIYEKTGTNTWTAYANNPVMADIGNTGDFFGSAVATNDESIIVGASGDSNGTGAVYIFQKDEDTEIWEQTQKLYSSDGDVNDHFGESVSSSGDYFVVGASLKDSLEGDVNSGAAYIFKYSTGWYEIVKLKGVDESNYEGNHFGESVYINGDNIIVGSPGARSDQGVADIFYKKRSWGHLIKLVGDDSSINDNFGTSVSISRNVAAVGSPDYESATTGGAVYLYEDPPVRLRLAQEFEVNNQFIPSKASVYLKRVGENTINYWPIYNTIETVIDATNFSTINQADTDTLIEFKADEFQKLIGGNSENNDEFGFSVDIDGNYMVVGANGESSGIGAAYVFYNDPNNPSDLWVEIKKLTASDGVAGDNFGIRVAIDGNYIVVGAYNSDAYNIYTGDVVEAGAAYVFYNDLDNPSDGLWVEIKKLTASDGTTGNQFSRGVSISGDYIVVGSPNDDQINSNSGAAYIYNLDLSDPSNEFVEIQKIKASDAGTSDVFGRDVQIDGNYIIVGARGDNASTGAVYIFYRNPNDPSNSEWMEIKKITASDGANSDQFGDEISISNNTIVVGAKNADPSGMLSAGAVYVFNIDEGGINNWGEVQKLIASDGETSDNFGSGVAIDDDYIVIGAPSKDGLGSDRGAVYVFIKSLDNVWIETKKITAKDAEDNDEFGKGISISGDWISVGAAREFGAGGAGAVYIFYKEFNYEGSNIIIFNDTIGGFTGNGYMIAHDNVAEETGNEGSASDFGIINYPIRAINSDTYDLWIRWINISDYNLTIDILIDGVVSKTIHSTIDDPSGDLEWYWVNTTIVLPDNRDHILGIRIKGNDTAIDKIYIDTNSSTPYTEGPVYSVSPYLTAHMKVYNSINEEPGYPLYIYDYKNSISEIIQDDWYNFNIKVLNTAYGYNTSTNFIGNYYLVMSVTGSNTSNFIIWELIDNDEYNAPASAIKF